MILVTGASGFVGRRVVAALTSGGHPVRALVRTEARAAELAQYRPEVARGDILQADSLPEACGGVDAVLHLAAVIREKGDATFQRVNYEGTRNLAATAAAAGVKRFILASTLGASPDPAIPYLYSRWMAEQEVARTFQRHTVIRFSVGFGEGDEFFNVLAALVRLSPVVPVVGDGSSRFQPIDIDDVARCMVAAYEGEGAAGEALELGGPQHLTYEDILDLVAETLGVRVRKIHLPAGLVAPLVAAMEAVAPRPPVTRQQLKMLGMDNTTDPMSVKKRFGFTPRPLRGSLGYLSKIGWGDALKISLGFMPAHIRDH